MEGEKRHKVKEGDTVRIPPKTGHWMIPEGETKLKILIVYSSKGMMVDEKVNSVLKKIEKFNEEVPSAIMPRASGELLSFLVHSTKAKKILELGCSVGYSTIWMANAAKQFEGQVYTTEKSEPRAELAKLNFQDSGLKENITLFEGNILEILSDWKHGELDFILLDAMKREYLQYYKLTFPLLKKGGIMVADDVIKLKEKMGDFLEFVKKDKNVYSMILDLDDGMLLIYKK